MNLNLIRFSSMVRFNADPAGLPILAILESQVLGMRGNAEPRISRDAYSVL